MADSGLSMALAVWGALTGTVACARTGWQWLHDRPKLKVDAHISITNTDVQGRIYRDCCFVVLFVNIVNTGHRQTSIKSITAPLTKDSLPIPQGATPELIESMRQLHTGGQLLIYGRDDDKHVEVKPDGGTFKIHQQLRKKSPLQPNEDNPKRATVTVELTSGKKIFATVELLSDDLWPPNAVE